MGENLALNLESKGFSVAVFNRTTEVTEKFAAGRAKEKTFSRRARWRSLSPRSRSRA